jgi:signal transduction histidine kinase
MLSTLPPAQAAPSPGLHSVRFYEDNEFLASEVTAYVARGLRTGHMAVVIARPELRAALLSQLNGQGLPRHGDELVLLDAEDTLDSFLVEGWPDEALFRAAIVPHVERGTRGGRQVCAFGEMVALLCQQGRYEAALHLEELWNGLRSVHNFSLLCAYPLRLFADEQGSRAFQHVCHAHQQVAPTEHADEATSAAHGLSLAQLQQKALALEHALVERDRLVEELGTANRAKDEFLAMLGHELRNPLSPIVTALELMKLRGDAGTAREQAMIRRQVDHLLRMVDDLMDVSRITRGAIELRRQVCKVADLVSQASEMAGPLVEQRRHHLSVVLDDPQLRCEGDPVRLSQVLANLLNNAARYTPPGGRVVVQARAQGDELELSVADNGAGIRADMLESIFEMFRQGRRGIDRREGGLGIGLALVRSLVGLHGGRVWAESAGPGCGSRFVVRLPTLVQRPCESGPRPVHEDVAAANDPVQARVLVVDDNREAADFLAELLAAYGCHARVAYDPAEALRLLDDFRPEVAILDIGLPVMDGYELAVRLRDKLGGSPCRLLALSGYGLPADRERSALAGFETHLVKPVDAATVATLINRC